MLYEPCEIIQRENEMLAVWIAKTVRCVDVLFTVGQAGSHWDTSSIVGLPA